MAATIELATQMTYTPAVGDVVVSALSFTAAAPTESVKSQFAADTTTYATGFTLDLGNIAVGSGYILWLHPIVGDFYFILGTTTGTPSATNSHLHIKEGEAYAIPINPNATMMLGVRGIAAGTNASTARLEYHLIG